jgi:hypothetical protein
MESARRTGLAVRTLHHYDAVGLPKPSPHTEAGYRLYTADDRPAEIDVSLRRITLDWYQAEGRIQDQSLAPCIGSPV